MPARIPVAEDDSSVRSFVSKALSAQGHDVTTVGDGLQALEALDKEAFHLLVTDIVMPGLDGIALALRAARDYPDLSVLVMTGYSAGQQKPGSLDRLAGRILLKPFTLRQISNAVEETLNQAAVVRRAAAQVCNIAG